MNSNQLYANGRVAVLSTRLLGADKFARLAECNTVLEALRVLTESGYANGITADSQNDYEVVLRSELDGALKLIKELLFDKYVLKFVLARYDYLNAKALMKSKYMRADGLGYCYNEASIPSEKMQNAFVKDDYSIVSKNMAEACDEIDTQYAAGSRSPQVIDKTLDKAMYADLRLYAKKCRVQIIKKLFDYEVNMVNISTIYRLKKANASKETYENLIIDGGTVKKETLLKLWDNEQSVADLPYEYKSFYALCTSDNADLIAAEKERKERQFAIISDAVDLMSVQPVLDYFYRKVNEIEKVRRVLIAIKSGQDKDKIKELVK